MAAERYASEVPRALDRRPSRGGARSGSRIAAAAVRALAERAVIEARGGRVTSALKLELARLDRTAKFTPAALGLFFDLLASLGLKTVRPIPLPVSDIPFWHRSGQPLAGYQSTPELPKTADIVVIGAGLTGASAAYHLRQSGCRVVVLDKGDPAGEASGRNGGNFELIPENSVGVYSGLARERFAFMRRCFPTVPTEVLDAISERQASAVFCLALKNRDLLRERILEGRMDCDFSPRGWLHIAASEEEEQGICEEVSLAAQYGQRIEIWSRGKIRAEFGFESPYLGRFVPDDGTYHPFKFVCGELQAAIEAGVGLYAGAPVRQIAGRGNKLQVETSRGSIETETVILATNAFTRELLPELASIKPYQSQIMVTERVADRARGRIVTSDDGPIFFNQPRSGADRDFRPLLLGGGDDRPMRNPASRRRSRLVHAHLMRLRDAFFPELSGQPPSAEWIGPMAFTPDGLPCIGFLRPGLIVAAGYNGYGGSYATAAGTAAAEMALTGRSPEWLPEDVFTPQRLTLDDPHFLSGRAALWRIAESLCDQLGAVNRRISEELALNRIEIAASSAPDSEGPAASTDLAIDIDRIRDLAPFSGFTAQELAAVSGKLRCLSIDRPAVLFWEGSAGGSCFFVVDGEVEVSIERRGYRQLLATLGQGSVFGQVSLIKRDARNATCSVPNRAVLLELNGEQCAELLDSGSPLALKLLAILNDGLIQALRDANRKLIRIATGKGSPEQTAGSDSR